MVLIDLIGIMIHCKNVTIYMCACMYVCMLCDCTI